MIPEVREVLWSFKVTVPVKEDLDDSVDYNKLTREFLECPERYFRHLFVDPEESR